MTEAKEKSGIYVVQIRKHLKLSQTEFAKKLGVTQGYISQVEGNKVDISFSTVIEWAKKLNISEINIKINGELLVITNN